MAPKGNLPIQFTDSTGSTVWKYDHNPKWIQRSRGTDNFVSSDRQEQLDREYTDYLESIKPPPEPEPEPVKTTS